MAGRPRRPRRPAVRRQRVAAELGIVPTTARRWMADGTVPEHRRARRARACPGATAGSAWCGRTATARQRILLPDLAEQLGVRYHELYHMVRRLGLTLEQHPATREYQITAGGRDTAPVRARAGPGPPSPVDEAPPRPPSSSTWRSAPSGSSPSAATSTSTPRPTAAAPVRHPRLGQACWIARNEPRSAERPAGRRASRSPRSSASPAQHRELMDLVRAGVLEQVPGRRACQLTAASLRSLDG